MWQNRARLVKARVSRNNESGDGWQLRILWWIIAAFTIAIPLFVSVNGEEVFRLPKELLLRIEALLVLVVMGVSWIVGRSRFRSIGLDRLTSGVVLSIVAVMIVTTLTSTNRAISLSSAGYTISCIVVFCAMYHAVARKNLKTVILVGTGPSVVNALLAVGQRLEWWGLFHFDQSLPPRERTTALIGNANDVGAYLAVSAIPLIAFAVIRRKFLPAAASVLILGGVVASDALTAILAVTAGIIVMAMLIKRRITVISLVAVVISVTLGFGFLPPLRTRLKTLVRAVKLHDLDALTSHRAISFATAWYIFREHPLTGAGPGTFKWHYMPYRLQVEMAHPEYYLKFLQNFGQAHNDHLQILAEEGLIGYGVVLFAFGVVASRTFVARKREQQADDRILFVRVLALPLAVCWFVLAAASFPLELVAVMTPLLFFVACILRWSHDAAQP